MSPLRDRLLVVVIAAGGAVGALARVAAERALPHDPGAWPWATFAVNLAGALLLGWLYGALPRSTYRRGLIGTGLCGALTTFSTLQVELVELARDGTAALTAGYAAASIALGLAAALAGVRLGERRGTA